jgi:hypothetical protein
MKSFALLSLVFIASGVAQQPGHQAGAGVIRGVVIVNDGSPAKGIRLTASPVGAALATRLPETRTDQGGNYRFDRLPWWSRYTVYADDPDAGYSLFSTGPAGPGEPPEVTISPQQPEATLDLRLPPRAGMLRIHLTNKQTGDAIAGLQVTVMSNQTPPQFLFSQSCGADRPILIPADKDVLLHVTSSGFHEWEEAMGRGKSIRLASGGRLELSVQLVPD